MTQGELEQIPLPFEKAMSDLESRVMSDLVGRLKANQNITSTADWEIERLHQLGMSDALIKNKIQETLKLTEKEINKLYSEAFTKDYVRNKDIYQQMGKSFLPLEENQELQELIEAVKKQTAGNMKNITQSLGFAIRSPDGKVIQAPIRDFYRDTLDNAMMDIATGAFDYQTVLKRTINQMTNSGLRSVDYTSGRSNRVDVAARRAVMTGFHQVQAWRNDQVAAELHTDYFEITWHAGARPEHQVWQGRVWSRKQLIDVCGLGEAGGLCGVNCYHNYNAFIPGVSTRTYTDAQLDQMNAGENHPREYNGKEYTTYEALQHQRKMETLMRKQRQDIKFLQEGEGSKDDIISAKAKYRSTMAQYADFSTKMKLPQQRNRIYQDGLGNIGAGKLPGIYASGQKTGIIKTWKGAAYSSDYTKKQAVERLKSEYGIAFKDSRKYPMDEKLLNDCVGWLDSFSKVFSGFKNRNPVKVPELSCLPPSKMKNAVGYYAYFPGTNNAVELALNGSYHTNIQAFQSYVDSCVKSGWYPANATVHKTFVHEYGHHVSHAMSQISAESAWQHHFLKDCMEEYNKSAEEKVRKCSDCAKLVSRYGATSESELFAECFAEYFGGENPGGFASVFGERLTKILEGVK